MSLAIDMNTPVGKVLADTLMDDKTLQIWSTKKTNWGKFYQTGFETILFKKTRNFAIETVLSSVLSWDKELLCIGNSRDLLRIKRIVKRNLFTCYSAPKVNIENLSHIVDCNRNITHLLVRITKSNPLVQSDIELISEFAQQHKLSLIVDCAIEVEGLNDRFNDRIDFMVCDYNKPKRHSFIIARRSQLVQTEGNSRNFCFDLYAFWQRMLLGRKAVIEPMYG